MAQFAPCPNCASTEADKQVFTWWGGIIGPALLTHVKCKSCGTTYNGKSGKSNNKAIAIYFAVVFGVFVIPCVAIQILAALN